MQYADITKGLIVPLGHIGFVAENERIAHTEGAAAHAIRHCAAKAFAQVDDQIGLVSQLLN